MFLFLPFVTKTTYYVNFILMTAHNYLKQDYKLLIDKIILHNKTNYHLTLLPT